MLAVSHPIEFTCDVARTGDHRAVTVGGDVDLHTAAMLRRSVDRAIRSGATSLVLDLRDVTFADLAALTFLLDLRGRARRGAIALELVPPPASVMRVFDVTQTREVLQFVEAA